MFSLKLSELFQLTLTCRLSEFQLALTQPPGARPVSLDPPVTHEPARGRTLFYILTRDIVVLGYFAIIRFSFRKEIIRFSK